MHDTQKAILKSFVKHHNSPLTTSHLLVEVFPDHSTDKQEIAKLHRKLLHHLNSLVTQDILESTISNHKGLKEFKPKLSADQELVIGRREKIVLSGKTNPNTPLESHREHGFISTTGGLEWTRKVNAILIESTLSKDIDGFCEQVQQTLLCVNDVVGLNDFESIIKQFSFEEVQSFIESIHRTAQFQEKRLTLIIDFTNITESTKILSFFTFFTKLQPSHITIVLDATTREMIFHKDLIEQMFSILALVGTPIHFKHDDMLRAPIVIGKQSTYAISEKEWAKYVSRGYKNARGLIISQLCVNIDTPAILRKFRLAKDIEQLFIDVAKSLFIANTVQRKDAYDIFSPLLNFDFDAREFFSHSQTTICLSKLPEETLFSQIQEKIMSFSQVQQLIYVSCGMPIRFEFGFSHADTQCLHINSSADFQSQELKDTLLREEAIHTLCKGDHTTCIHRSGSPQARDLFAELTLLLNTYKIPSVLYSFERVSDATLKLEDFFDGD